MAKRKNRYKAMDQLMTRVLIADGGIFLLYLLFAGFGIGPGKVIMAILGILLSALCLGFLFMTNELLRKRSLWMTAAAASIIICIIVSLIANYPSPNPLKDTSNGGETTSVSALVFDFA